MQYLGGKARLGKRIAEVITSLRTPGQSYLEPFVGACNIAIHLDPSAGPRVCSDVDRDIVALWRSVQCGWLPPADVDEDQYREARLARNDNVERPELCARRAFIRSGCSWGGKPWGGFARNPRAARNYAAVGRASVERKAPLLAGIKFVPGDYTIWNPKGWIVYCDCPYEGTTGYGRPFDNAQFWDVVRRWSMCNTVLVSEYAAPDDFACVWSRPFTRGLDDARIIEKVFRYAPSPRSAAHSSR